MRLMPQSPSSVGTYKTCPKQYQAKYITNEVKFAPTAETARGERWHKYLEDRLGKNRVILPEEVAHFESVMQRMERFSGEMLTEFTLAINDKFQPCEWKERYIGGKIDLGIIDHDNLVIRIGRFL